MSVTVTERTRRRGVGTCCHRDCIYGGDITPGQVYREMVAVQHDAFDRGFVRRTIHDLCIGESRGDREWWALRDAPKKRRTLCANALTQAEDPK